MDSYKQAYIITQVTQSPKNGIQNMKSLVDLLSLATQTASITLDVCIIMPEIREIVILIVDVGSDVAKIVVEVDDFITCGYICLF